MNYIWETISNLDNLVGLIIGCVAIAGLIYSCYWFLARSLQRIYSELIPNGGNSLRDKIDKLDSLFKASLRINGKPFMMYSPLGELIDMSDDLSGLTGLSPKQLCGLGWINTIDEDDILDLMEHWNMAIKHKIEFDHNYNLIRFDQSKVKIRHRVVPMFIHKAEGQELIGFLGWIDIPH